MQHDIEAIRKLAYQLYLERHGAHGSAEQDWLVAERRVADARPSEPVTASSVPAPADAAAAASDRVDESLQETFPASDPPASHLPDLPPANAAEKSAASAARRKTKTATAGAKGTRSKSGAKSSSGKDASPDRS